MEMTTGRFWHFPACPPILRDMRPTQSVGASYNDDFSTEIPRRKHGKAIELPGPPCLTWEGT
jgi:hypothetical protein